MQEAPLAVPRPSALSSSNPKRGTASDTCRSPLLAQDVRAAGAHHGVPAAHARRARLPRGAPLEHATTRNVCLLFSFPPPRSLFLDLPTSTLRSSVALHPSTLPSFSLSL
eukprot:499511-Pleurochrysis_carterae.AAC.1